MPAIGVTVDGTAVSGGAAVSGSVGQAGTAVQGTQTTTGRVVTSNSSTVTGVVPSDSINILSVEQIDRTLAGSRVAGSPELDAHVANELILNSQEKIARARFALAHSTHDSVRQMAQLVIDDHTASITALQPFASFEANLLRLGVEVTATSEAVQDAVAASSVTTSKAVPEAVVPPAGQVQIGANAGETRGVANNPNGSSTELIDAYLGPNKSILNQRIFAMNFRTKQVLMLLNLRDLGAESAADFDAAYVRSELGMHTQRLSLLTAAEGNVTGPLEQAIVDEQTKTIQHKGLLMDLRKLLEAGHAPESSTLPPPVKPE